MLFKTHGIVFNAVKFSETSLIAKIYTRSFGLQSYIVKGARAGGKKNKASFFQPLNILDLEVYRRENRNIQFLKDFSMGHIFRNLPFDVVKSSIAVFLLEILNSVIHEEECNERLYDFLEQEIKKLDESGTVSNFHLHFLVRMTEHLGFFPGKASGPECYFDLREGRFVSAKPQHLFFMPPHLSNLLSEIAAGVPVRLTLLERNVLLEKLLLYYHLHISDFRKIKSHKILSEVLAA